MAGLDPELLRFLREELGHDVPSREWTCTGPVWVWKGANADGKPSPTAWHFLTITGEIADAIRAAAPGRSAAWGSLPVTARIGPVEWRTSVFPSRNVAGYLLPLKAAVRKKVGVGEGDEVTVELRL